MAPIVGYRTIMDHALPTGVDGGYLAKWELRDGRSWQDVISTVAMAISAQNQRFLDRWGWLFYVTEEVMVEYPNGGSVNKMPRVTDVDDITPEHETTIGHMLALYNHGKAIGGSKKYFRDMRSAKLIADIKGMTDAAEWRFEWELLNRLFVDTEYQIGTSGYNVPFVRGSGGNVDYVPPAYDGEAFDGNHTHYIGYDSDNDGYDDMLNGLAETLEEHGHDAGDAGFVALVSKDDVSSYQALPNFVKPIPSQVVVVDRGTTTTDSGAAFFSSAAPPRVLRSLQLASRPHGGSRVLPHSDWLRGCDKVGRSERGNKPAMGSRSSVRRVRGLPRPGTDPGPALSAQKAHRRIRVRGGGGARSHEGCGGILVRGWHVG